MTTLNNPAGETTAAPHEQHRKARVVLIGTGIMGKIRASKMYANPRFDLAGICDAVNFSAAQELAALYSTKAFHGLDEAVALFGVKEKEMPEQRTVTGISHLDEEQENLRAQQQEPAARPRRSSSEDEEDDDDDDDACSSSAASSPSPVPSVVSANSSSCSRSASSSLTGSGKGLDGIVISVRTAFHAQYIEAAARYGLAIFVEKPVAETPDEIQHLFAVCAQHGVALCCGFQRRFDDSYVAAARAIQAGQIGKPLSGHVFFGDSPCPPLDFLLQGGNIFADLSVHDVDFIRWALQDDIETVYATATCSSAQLEKHGVHDNATMVMKFTKGTIVTLTLSRWSCYGYDQRCEIFGERGMVSVRNPHATTTVVADETGEHSSRLENSFPQRYHAAFAAELDAFCDTILLGKPWSVTQRDVIAVQKVAQAAQRACETQTALEVERPHPWSIHHTTTTEKTEHGMENVVATKAAQAAAGPQDYPSSSSCKISS